MQQIDRLINLDTLELFVYVYTLDNLSLYDMYLYVCIVLFVFKDDYFNETRLSEIKYFRFDKFVRSPALYFW